MKRKHFVLGIDGLPYHLLLKLIQYWKLDNFERLIKKYNSKEINSVYPVVSSVAWTSYATGTNPGNHNIFGFTDRIIDPFSINFPTTNDLYAETLWEKLSKKNKKVIVINVPLTYPPRKVNGILVSCFLSPAIEKAAYPKEISSYLREQKYVIDIDAKLAEVDKRLFIKELISIMNKRFQVCCELMQKKEWDFVQLHIMETDRLFHFLWTEFENLDNSSYQDLLKEFFVVLDGHIGTILQQIIPDSGFSIISDHGFCEVKYEVQMNSWLVKEGLLTYHQDNNKTLLNFSGDTVCYSLTPGRIYLNLEGREPHGLVKPQEYDKYCQMIKNRVLDIRDDNNNKIIDRVYQRDEIFHGKFIKNAPDLVVCPKDGYDLKSRINEPAVFQKRIINGMHTFDHATLISTLDITKINGIEEISNEIYKEIFE